MTRWASLVSLLAIAGCATIHPPAFSQKINDSDGTPGGGTIEFSSEDQSPQAKQMAAQYCGSEPFIVGETLIPVGVTSTAYADEPDRFGSIAIAKSQLLRKWEMRFECANLHAKFAPLRKGLPLNGR